MLDNLNLKFFKPCEFNKSYSWTEIENQKQDIFLLEQNEQYAKLLFISPTKEMMLITFDKNENKFVEAKRYSPDEE